MLEFAGSAALTSNRGGAFLLRGSEHSLGCRKCAAAAVTLGDRQVVCAVHPSDERPAWLLYPLDAGIGVCPNMAPPTICLLVFTVLQVAVVMLLRPALQPGWLQREKPWTVVVAGNGVIMTIFLWHLSAMLLAVSLLYPLGFPQPDGGTVVWWITWPLWILVGVIPLVAIVALMGRFERPPPTRFRGESHALQGSSQASEPRCLLSASAASRPARWATCCTALRVPYHRHHAVPGDDHRGDGLAVVALVRNPAARSRAPGNLDSASGRLAQLEERLPYKQEAVGSSPAAPTRVISDKSISSMIPQRRPRTAPKRLPA